MRMIDGETVHALLDYPDFVEALAHAHHDDTETTDDLLLEQAGASGEPSHFFIRAAWQRGRSAGAKIVTIFPDNHRPGSVHPAIQGTYVLFDGANGAPLACIDGTALTWRKTAGDSALGARFLARRDSHRMLMIGAGAMAPQLIRAHCAVRPGIRQVDIWNRSADKAARLADTLDISGVEIRPARDLKAAAREADLISAATAAGDPLLCGDWLKTGTHVDLVGAYTKSMREADSEVFRRGRIYVDFRGTTIGCIGELIVPMREGVFTEADIVGDLYDLCRGSCVGRQTEEEITVFKNGGGGHLDLMTARIVYDRASVAGR